MKKQHLHFLLILLLVSCQEQPMEISQWRGPNRDGFYPDTGLLKQWPEGGPELLWTFEDLGIGYATAAVTSEKIFITGTFDSTSYLFALDQEGNLIWKKEYGKAWMTNFPGARSTPVIAGNHGYVLSGLGKLVCFETAKGDFIWTKDLYADFVAREVRFGMTENLLIDGDVVYCTPGGVKSNVVALNRFTGDVVWISKGNMEPSAYCSPALIDIKGRKTLVTITANSIIALDPGNGSLLWSHDLLYPNGIHGNMPVYYDGYIFAMNGWDFGSVMMKVKEDGSGVEEAWRSTLFDLEHGDAIRIGNNLYGTDYTTRHFSCIDWYTGAVKDSIDRFAPGTVIAADGMIYCYAYSGAVALIRPTAEGFEVVSSFDAPGMKRDHIAHPVIHDRKLYLRYANALMVYDIARKDNI